MEFTGLHESKDNEDNGDDAYVGNVDKSVTTTTIRYSTKKITSKK